MFLLLFALGVSYCDSYEPYICTFDHTVEVNAETVVFFESPDFPKTMTDDDRDNCFINFTKNLTPSEKDKKLVVALSNILCSSSLGCVNLFTQNADSYLFQPYSDYYQFIAFQGYAYFDDWSNDCPFESLSRVEPFEFDSISQIIMLQSSYNASITRKQSCLWQFKAPRGYGFKIVITNFNMSSNTTFQVDNIRDPIITKENIRLSEAHYTTDNYIKIFFSENNDSYIPADEYGNSNFEFTAYITIIKNNFNQIDIECFVYEENENVTSWYYFDGYPNNARCEYLLKIKPNTEVTAAFIWSLMENNVDVINYYEFNNSLPTKYDPTALRGGIVNQQVFTAIDNETEKHILWEFLSDQSVISQGFQLQFRTTKCSCGNYEKIIPCSGEAFYYIMNDYDDYCCGNLNCNFTFVLAPECHKQLMIFHIGNAVFDEETVFDDFKIISNGEIIFKINFRNFNQDQSYPILALSSKNQNIFQAITALSILPRALEFSISAVNVSCSLPNIVLNSSFPYYFYSADSQPFHYPSMILIELSPEMHSGNYTIHISTFYAAQSYSWSFFSDQSLSEPLSFQDCFTLTHTYPQYFKCETRLKSFVIVQNYVQDFVVQVFDGNKYVGSEGCIFKPYLINFDYGDCRSGGTPMYATAMSNGENVCTLFAYAPSDPVIKNMWITPNSNGTIRIFGGSARTLLASINAKSAPYWHDISSSHFLMVEIPLNSAVMVQGYSADYCSERAKMTEYPYYSVVTSPFYGYDDKYEYALCNNTAFQIYDVYKYSVKFTILDINIMEKQRIYFFVNNTQTNITSSTSSYIFPPSLIELRCFCTYSERCSIRMFVETIPNDGQVIQTLSQETTATSTTADVTTKPQKSFSALIHGNNFLIFLLQLF